MINERYLEYLALNSVLQDYLYIDDYVSDKSTYDLYLANNSKIKLDLKELRTRVTELQKEFLEKYIMH